MIIITRICLFQILSDGTSLMKWQRGVVGFSGCMHVEKLTLHLSFLGTYRPYGVTNWIPSNQNRFQLQGHNQDLPSPFLPKGPQTGIRE